jgi:hypothetical protein
MEALEPRHLGLPHDPSELRLEAVVGARLIAGVDLELLSAGLDALTERLDQRRVSELRRQHDPGQQDGLMAHRLLLLATRLSRIARIVTAGESAHIGSPTHLQPHVLCDPARIGGVGSAMNESVRLLELLIGLSGATDLGGARGRTGAGVRARVTVADES